MGTRMGRPLWRRDEQRHRRDHLERITTGHMVSIRGRGAYRVIAYDLDTAAVNVRLPDGSSTWVERSTVERLAVDGADER